MIDWEFGGLPFLVVLSVINFLFKVAFLGWKFYLSWACWSGVGDWSLRTLRAWCKETYSQKMITISSPNKTAYLPKQLLPFARRISIYSRQFAVHVWAFLRGFAVVRCAVFLAAQLYSDSSLQNFARVNQVLSEFLGFRSRLSPLGSQFWLAYLRFHRLQWQFLW